MNFRSIRPALPVLACTLALPILAAAAPALDLAALNQSRTSVQVSAAAARGAVTATAPPAKEIFANPYRAYPPSCLADGLPFGQFDAVRGAQASVLLFGDPAQCLSGGNANECNYTETDTVKVWRVPCSGGTSAVLVEIDRPADASTTLYPTLPGIYAVQGSNALYVRYADDANTLYTTTYANTPLVNSDIFVLENFYGGATQFNYNQAFTLFVDNFTGNTATNPRSFTFTSYNPANYPDAALPLEISGYLSTNWYDPAHNGEGMLVQVYDNNDGATRTFTAAWYTFDGFGLPFWLYAQGTIDIGDRSTGNVDTYYATNGGFAGNFGPNATFTKWGTINVSFPDCNSMSFTYSGATDAQTNGPGGSGTRSGWIRLANINSLVCN